MRRLSRALRERYALREPDVAFFDLFASPVAGFEENALAIIEYGLDRGVEPRLVRRRCVFCRATSCYLGQAPPAPVGS